MEGSKERERERDRVEEDGIFMRCHFLIPSPDELMYAVDRATVVVHKSLCHMWLCICSLRICCATESSANIRIVVLMSALHVHSIS